MDQGLKERLIGGAVLVALAVWLIPLLLKGPDDTAPTVESTLHLPLPAGSVKSPPLRTEVIDLEAPSSPPSPSGVANGRDDGVREDHSGWRPSRSDADDRPVAASRVGSTHEQGTDGGTVAMSRSGLGGKEPVNPPSRGDTPPGHSEDQTKTGTSSGASESVARKSMAPTPPARVDTAAQTGPATQQLDLPGIAPNGNWAIQLGSFGEEENAGRLAKRVASYGANAFVSPYKADSRTMFRVRIGPFASRATAESGASVLRAHGFVAEAVMTGD